MRALVVCAKPSVGICPAPIVAFLNLLRVAGDQCFAPLGSPATPRPDLALTMACGEFSDADKLAEVRRQLATWRKTYPHAIRQGMITPHEVAHRLRLWEAIEADYVARKGFVAA